MTTIELTDSNFESTIKDNSIVLVDFWATWCGPCRQFAPIFEQSANKNPDIVHGKLDTEAAERTAAAAGITAIPTLMAFREGVLVFQPDRRSSCHSPCGGRRRRQEPRHGRGPQGPRSAGRSTRAGQLT